MKTENEQGRIFSMKNIYPLNRRNWEQDIRDTPTLLLLITSTEEKNIM